MAERRPEGGAPRHYHLGLDWGTSTTKLVLRDYSLGSNSAAYVLRPTGTQEGGRYPSAASVHNGLVLLGDAAVGQRGTTEYSLKAKAETPQLFGTRVPGATRLTYEALATLYLAHVMKLALDVSSVLAHGVGQHPRLGVTLGIPTERGWKETLLAPVFLRMARTAYDIGVRRGIDPQGCSEQEAEKLLRVERPHNSRTNTPNYEQWLRPELGAAMLWAFRSPAIAPGLYSCVDIGAWTVNTSYFRIRHDHLDGEYRDKGGLSFFGGACGPPGMNEVCTRLANALRVVDPTELRGREDALLDTSRERLIEPAVKKMLDVWRAGFEHAYQKEQIQERWRELRVFAIGGGSKVRAVRKRFRQFPVEHWPSPKEAPVLGPPKDLYEVPLRGVPPRTQLRGDHVFLHVAYGLSVRHDDFPSFQLSDSVSTLTRRDTVAPGDRRMNVRCRCGGITIPGSDRCRDCE